MLFKWQKTDTNTNIIEAADNELDMRCVTLPSGKRNTSHVVEMEIQLVTKIKDHHVKDCKVPQRWICLISKKIQFTLDT